MLKFYADESRDPETSLFFAAGLLMTESQAISLEAGALTSDRPFPFLKRVGRRASMPIRCSPKRKQPDWYMPTWLDGIPAIRLPHLFTPI